MLLLVSTLINLSTICTIELHVLFVQSILSRNMAMAKRFHPSLGLLITSTVRSGISYQAQMQCWLLYTYPSLSLCWRHLNADSLSEDDFWPRTQKLSFFNTTYCQNGVQPIKNASGGTRDQEKFSNGLWWFIFSFYLLKNFDCRFGYRSKRISKNQNQFFSRADKSQLSVVFKIYIMNETTH